MTVTELHNLLSTRYSISFDAADTELMLRSYALAYFKCSILVANYPEWQVLQNLFCQGLPRRPRFVSSQTIVNLLVRCLNSAPSLWTNSGGTLTVYYFICRAAVRYLKDDPAWPK